MPWQGELIGIFIAPTKGQEMVGLGQVEALTEQGLAGDRYAADSGTIRKSIRHVTLIEAEALEALARDYQIELAPEQTRRNLVVKDVPLNHLVNQIFEINGVLIKGVELCEPCGYLEKRTQTGVQEGLKHRGGLRAQILQGGYLKLGDKVRPQGN